MKKIYNAPEAIEVLFDSQDVITVSGEGMGIVGSGDGMTAEW